VIYSPEIIAYILKNNSPKKQEFLKDFYCKNAQDIKKKTHSKGKWCKIVVTW
jgi:hypothetical protein